MTHPKLQAAFATNAAALERIAQQDPDGLIRRQAERALAEAEGKQIAGLEKIAEDCAKNVLKLKSLTVELRFAILFVKLGARVRILRDGEFGPGRIYTPDLHVSFNEGLEALVDVVCLSYGDPDLTTPLQLQIDATALPFRVTTMVGKSLSTAQISGINRTTSTALAERVVNQGATTMTDAWKTGQSAGVVHVVASGSALRSIVEGASERLPHLEDVPLAEGEEWMASFVFEPSPLGSGYASGGVTSVHFFDDEGQGLRFCDTLKKKAERTAHLPEARRKMPFIVAVQNDEVELSPTTALSILTGSRSHLSTSSQAVRDEWLRRGRAKYPAAAIAALQSVWCPVLEAWGYGADAPSLLTSFGAYLEEPWATHLSGVLLTHHSSTRLQWLPNPFALAPLADPRLLELGLSLDALGVDLRQQQPRA